MRDELDHRCDIYSFGMVCYEVLAGRHPFSEVRNNIQALVSRHLREMPLQLRAYNRDVSPEIEAAIMQMLAKEAGGRPQSAFALRQAIANSWTGRRGRKSRPQKSTRDASSARSSPANTRSSRWNRFWLRTC